MESCRKPAEDRASESADHALRGRAQRPADRALHHDNDGEHRPVALWQAESLVGSVSRADGNGDTYGLA